MDYVERLCAAGMRVDDACLLVNDFSRDFDFEGLEKYAKEYERLSYVGEVQR